MLYHETLERLIEHGFHIFPVSKTKKPLTPHGWKDATNDFDTLMAMFEDHKDRDPQIAIACEPSGLFVLDIDRKSDKDGFTALKALWEQYESLPPTVMVTTPNDGIHLYFRGLGKSTAGKLGVGLDTRSKGGYVVCPPSVSPHGIPYEWHAELSLDEMPIAEAPAWLIQLAEGDTATAQHQEQELSERVDTAVTPQRLDCQEDEDDIIPEGERNDTLFKRACSLRGKGLSQVEILGAIGVVNAQHCEPPLPTEEVMRIVESACKYARGTSQQSNAMTHEPTERTDGMALCGLEPLTDLGNTRRFVHWPALLRCRRIGFEIPE